MIFKPNIKKGNQYIGNCEQIGPPFIHILRQIKEITLIKKTTKRSRTTDVQGSLFLILERASTDQVYLIRVFRWEIIRWDCGKLSFTKKEENV